MLKFAVTIILIIAIITMLTCINLNKSNKQKYFPLVVSVGSAGMLIIAGGYIYYNL